MPHMRILKVTQKIISHTQITTFFLIDEQQQYLISFPLQETIFPGPMRLPSQRKERMREPLTIDFLSNVLHALGGTIEAIVLTPLYDLQFSAQVQLRDQYGQQAMNAPLNDVLRLAQRENSRIEVSPETLAQQGIRLKEYGTTLQEQLTAIERLAEQDPDALRPIPEEPCNLDFADGLRDWKFSRSPEYGSYTLDPHVTFNGKACLAITLHKPYTSGSANVLSHTRFLARRYRGKRICLTAYVKRESIHQPMIELMVSGPAEAPGSLAGKPLRPNRVTRSRLIPATHDGWTRHELVIDVPDNAHDIHFSLSTQEQGKLWIGGISFEVVEQNIALTGTFLRPPAQHPLNLDFSQGLEYWTKEGSAPWHYECGLENEEAPASAYLKALVAKPDGQCSIQQMLNAEHYQGKQVRLRAHLKAVDVEKASLFIGGPFTGIGERIEETIKGTTQWAPYTLTYYVPQTAWNLLSFGISLHSQGQIWLKEVTLDVIENHPAQ